MGGGGVGVRWIRDHMDRISLYSLGWGKRIHNNLNKHAEPPTEYRVTITLCKTSRWLQNKSSNLAWPSQSWTFVLKSTGGFAQCDGSPCILLNICYVKTFLQNSENDLQTVFTGLSIFRVFRYSFVTPSLVNTWTWPLLFTISPLFDSQQDDHISSHSRYSIIRGG